jgi:hypothetical protein
MTFNAAAVTALFAQVTSHAASLGLFEQVPQHEPKTAPQSGLSAAIWVTDITPVQSSGLASTSGKVVFNVRVYSNMLAEPQDSIDPDILSAVCVLLAEYSGAFTLGGSVREVDLLGEHGDSLSAKAAYLQHDNRMFRVMDVTLPIIINDLWTQVA